MPSPTQTAETEAPKAVEERDTKGRFVKGNKGGPGNPYNRQTAYFRKKALESITEDMVRSIVTILFEKAESGDLQACKTLLDMACGKPAEAFCPDQALRDDYAQQVRDMVDEKTADSSFPTP